MSSPNSAPMSPPAVTPTATPTVAPASNPAATPAANPTPARLIDAAHAGCSRISAGDTVRLAVVRGPDTLDPSSVSLEIWDPGGAQPSNSHPQSVETFWFLRGSGMPSVTVSSTRSPQGSS